MAEVRQNRMEWLDAMRGFTMILVVAYHVAQLSFGESEKNSSSLPFLVLFRMPLFFFVSGFLAYKSTWLWTASNFVSLLWKKTKVQLIPTVIFLCVLLVFRRNESFLDAFSNAMHSPTKNGYWFTWALLQMFAVYYVVAFMAQRWCRNSHILIVVVWIIAMGVYESLFLPQTLGKWYLNSFVMQGSIYGALKFFHFFLLGNIVHRCWNHVQHLMDTRWFFPLVAVVATLSCADIFQWHTFQWQWTNLPKTAAMYSLMLIVIMFFRRYQASFSQQHKAGRALQYIGTRTLDIYLLHFILLPKLPQVGEWLNGNRPNFVIDICLSVSMALVVIAFCLLASNVLRVSPVLSEYLFGRKPNGTQHEATHGGY